MGSKVGILKVAAKQLGLSLEEYMAHIDAGEKWCHKGKHWKAVAGFGIDRTRGDGHKAVCQDCDYVRTTSAPGKKERQQKRLMRLAYCRKCNDWLPVADVRRGICRMHINQEARERYATEPDYRSERKQHAHARKRGVEPVPVIGQETILAEFKGLCAYCGNIATTWDHVTPINKGGRAVPYNIVPACISCNSSKGDRDVYEWAKCALPSPFQAFYDRIDLEWCGLLTE